MGERLDALNEAARQLVTTPAHRAWDVWRKWEVLDAHATEDAEDGAALDNRTLVTISCIRADILRLGIGKDGVDV